MKVSLRKPTILVIIVGALIILSLNLFQKEVKSSFYFVSSPIQKSLWRVGDSISDFFAGIFQAKDLREENEELKLKLQELLAENSSLLGLKEENQALREVLEVGLQKEFRLTLAGVIGKDIDQDSLLIDKGAKVGISKGMPVVTSQKVLLGQISEVYDNYSRVRLISNEESSFDAKILDTKISGLIRGKGSLKASLELVPREEEIKEGDLLVTSALGGIYPQGIPAGIIGRVEKSDIKPFQTAEISLFFDISSLENVFVIINYLF